MDPPPAVAEGDELDGERVELWSGLFACGRSESGKVNVPAEKGRASEAAERRLPPVDSSLVYASYAWITTALLEVVRSASIDWIYLPKDA